MKLQFPILLLTQLIPFVVYADFPEDDQQSIFSDIELKQSDILNGDHSFRKLQEIGRHLFVSPFTSIDGFGEGETGARVKAINTRRMTPGDALFQFPTSSFLRFNGLDSQSCFECHNATGIANQADSTSTAFSRKVGASGGTAGIASNAFINPLIQDPVPDELLDEVPESERANFLKKITLFVRNPPHVYGSGYVQKLAQEMSLELLTQRADAIAAFLLSDEISTTADLSAKGVSFGTYGLSRTVVTESATSSAGFPENPLLDQIARGITKPCGELLPNVIIENCGLAGVSDDFIVRPLQWKGVASNLRNFVRDATNFHFGIQSQENFPGDCDGDGVSDELSVGEVTALTLFATSIRPPVVAMTSDPVRQSSISNGMQLFNNVGCASCHVNSLPITDSEIGIRNPVLKAACAGVPESILETLARGPSESLPLAANGIGLSAAERKEVPLPIERLFLKNYLDSIEGDDPRAFQSMSTAMEDAGDALPEYFTFDLNMPPELDALQLSMNRLAQNPDGSIDVPLFSDLKRHRMGSGLADVLSQGTDREGILVDRDLFLTRPLWGVADSGPWLHDGRATTLLEAIVGHKSDPIVDAAQEVEFSEANDEILQFEALSESDKSDIISFLSTLRLPYDERYSFDRK